MRAFVDFFRALPSGAMSPDDLKALRKELGCTARELATALGIEQETVLGWERGDLFPTKRFVDAMTALKAKGPAAVPKQKRKGAVAASPMAALASPDVWKLVRKLIAHPELRKAATALAEAYPDPADEPGG